MNDNLRMPILSPAATMALLRMDFRPGAPLHRSTAPEVVTELWQEKLVNLALKLTGYGARVRARLIDQALDEMERRAAE